MARPPAAAAALCWCLGWALGAAAEAPGDLVASLPGYGAPKTRQYSGYSDATPDGKNKLFYWFVEAEVGSASLDTPLLIWLNGGPGASSMMGLLAERLGPQMITAEGRLADNPTHIAKKYHLMAVDNPVGAGFSYTEGGAYVRTEAEMRTQFVHALRGFYAKHPEYKANPLWITGESYAGKYVPNIAYELAVNATEIPLRGIVVGNGLYDEAVQYQTIGELAFGAGVIDENMLEAEKKQEARCLEQIARGWERAGDFCENVTVRRLYVGPEAAAGELFYYDFGVTDAKELDAITDHIGVYLNSPEVKSALHATNSTWQNADETGPVAEALLPDFTIPSAPVVAKLLGTGKQVTLYNGVRDGSVCNHIGNLRALLKLDWPGADEFRAAAARPWPSSSHVMGHVRGAQNLRFATVMRTGHLVPMAVPDAFAVLLEMALQAPAEAASEVLV